MVELRENGPCLSPVVAGAWRTADCGWNAAERLRWIEPCADLGVTGFDHADIDFGYRIEALREALAALPLTLERHARARAVVRPVAGRRRARRALNADLRHLPNRQPAHPRALLPCPDLPRTRQP